MNVTKLPFYSLFTIIFYGFLQLALNNAYAEATYTIENISVQAEGQNATEARTAAIEDGQAKAFAALLQKLSAAPQPSVPAAQISRMVRGIEVLDEKISSNRYRATLTVSFIPSSVRSYLQQNKISYNPNIISPTLILPLLFSEEETAATEDSDNPWQHALSKALQTNNVTAYKLPMGDLEDITQIKNIDTATADFSQLSTLTTKYAVERILFATAKTSTDPATGTLALDVTVTTLSSSKRTSQTHHYTGTAGETLASLFGKAAQEIITPVKKTSAAAAVPKGTKILLNANFSTLQGWMKIRQALSEKPMVQKLDITQLSTSKAELEVYFQGTQADLQRFLQQKGLTATQEGALLTVQGE